MRRALRGGGRIAAVVYSTPERNEFFSLPVSIIRTRAECTRFERESFGALHRFETGTGFTGPCEILVAAGTR